jgi:hypothetical protein
MMLMFMPGALTVDVIMPLEYIGNDQTAAFFIFHFAFHPVAHSHRIGAGYIIQLQHTLGPAIPKTPGLILQGVPASG